MNQISGILILGKYGSGKSDFLNFLEGKFTGERSVIRPLHITSDRIFIEEQVIKDVFREGAPEPGRRGPHSTLFKPHAEPGFREFSVVDGTLHHHAHVEMINYLDNPKSDELHIIEIGIGPDVIITKGKEPLRQSGEYFLNLLRHHGIDKRILIVETEAPYPVREGRNNRRPDPVPPEIFAIAAADGGEFWRTSHGLGDRYFRLDNETDDPALFRSRAEKILTEGILPYIQNEGPKISVEGRPASAQQRSRR